MIKGSVASAALSRDGATAAGPASGKPVSGDGSNDNPFTAPCDDPSLVDCVVNSFPARKLDGFWANEHVPAYKCPSDHPYMFNNVARANSLRRAQERLRAPLSARLGSRLS